MQSQPVFLPRFSTQIPKGRAIAQFCVVIEVVYSVCDSKGGAMAPCPPPPPKYAPDAATISQSRPNAFEMRLQFSENFCFNFRCCPQIQLKTQKKFFTAVWRDFVSKLDWR